MVDNTRMQTMQNAINKLAEQSNGYSEQLQIITQTLASIQFQLNQKNERSMDRASSSAMFTPTRHMKVDFPTLLDWGDVIQWIYKAERFFRVYDIPEDQKMDIVAVNLEGRVLSWFQIWEKLNP